METVLLHKSAFLCVTPFFYLSSFGSANALLTGVTKTFVPFYSFFPEILGNFVALLILAVNALFTGLLLFTAYSPHIQPVTHPVQSCLGLTFPVFLMINIGFFIFWLVIQRYKTALLPLIGLLLCYSQTRTYLPINFHTNKLPETSFKLLSYNIMGFDGAIKQNGKNPILTYLKESNADILCLQEYSTTESSRHLSQKDVEQELKAYPYHRINTVGREKGHTNKIACYSKYPILSARVLDYSSEYNGSVLYEVKIGEDTVTLINNHLESNKLTKADKAVYENMLKSPEKEKVKSGMRLLIRKLAEASAIRAPQADTIAHEITASPHPCIIVCGDFNDTPISYTHRTIAQNLDDAFTKSGRGLGISYNQNRFYFRIDNILTSKNLKAYNCTVDRSIKDSDHYPIWCYITKKN